MKKDVLQANRKKAACPAKGGGGYTILETMVAISLFLVIITRA
ncbi:MAG: hypothetical protein WDN09_02220 [bacterium]